MDLVFVRHERSPLQPIISAAEMLLRIGAGGFVVRWSDCDGPITFERNGLRVPLDNTDAFDFLNNVRARQTVVEDALEAALKGGDLSSYVDDPDTGVIYRVPAMWWNIADWRGFLDGSCQSLHIDGSDFALRSRPLLFSRSELDDWSACLPDLIPQPARTGLPGRPPLSRGLIHAEFQRRCQNGLVEARISAEVRALRAWLKREHQGAEVPAPKSLENSIRDAYNAHKRSLGMAQN